MSFYFDNRNHRNFQSLFILARYAIIKISFSLSFFAIFFKKRAITDGNNCPSGLQNFLEKILKILWKVKFFKKVTTIGFFVQRAIKAALREVNFARDEQNS